MSTLIFLYAASYLLCPLVHISFPRPVTHASPTPHETQTFLWDYSLDRDNSGYKYFRNMGEGNVGYPQKSKEDQGNAMLQLQPSGIIDATVCPQGSCLRLYNPGTDHERQRFRVRNLILSFCSPLTGDLIIALMGHSVRVEKMGSEI